MIEKEAFPLDKTLLQQWLRGIWVALIISVTCMLLYYLIPVVYPFLIGWIIAYILNPLVTLLQRKVHFPRWLAVTVCLVLFITTAVGFITLMVTNIVVETGNLADTLQTTINRWTSEITTYIQSDPVQNIINQATAFYNENPKYQETINTNLSSTAHQLANIGSILISFTFNLLIALLKALPTIAAVTVIALLAAFFISKDWFKMMMRLSAFFSAKTRRTASIIWGDLQRALFGYARAQLIMISMTAVFIMIGLIIMKVKYAVAIALLIGFVDLLPYLGTGAAMVPWIVVVFIQKNIALGIGLSILYGIVLVARQILEPKVLATSVGLNPLATLIAMVVGLHFFGVLGLIVGPVSLIIIFTLYKVRVFHDILDYVAHGKGGKVE